MVCRATVAFSFAMGLAIVFAMGCGSVTNKPDAAAGGTSGGSGGMSGGVGGSGGAAPTDSGAGGSPVDGAAGASGDGSVDLGPPPDGGGVARWDIDKWDNARWN
jgi:hypothetical protein